MIDLSAGQLEIIREVLGLCLGISDARVYLHGSRANGTAWKYSDIDLAIDAPFAIDPLLADRIRSTISAAGIPYRVDITDLNGRLSPIFLENVNRCRELIFEGRHLIVQLPKDFWKKILSDAQAMGMAPHAFVTKILGDHYGKMDPALGKISNGKEADPDDRAHAAAGTAPDGEGGSPDGEIHAEKMARKGPGA